MRLQNGFQQDLWEEKPKTNKAHTFTERMAASVEGVNSCSGLHDWSTFQTAPKALQLTSSSHIHFNMRPIQLFGYRTM